MLYQKHRPATISEMLGNKKTLAAFEKHFSNPIHSHVHCLIGPRGCGKTSAARIAATSILGASELGTLEINCGTERGVAAMKDIIDLAPYRPPVGKCRVFILDEAHSLLAPGKKALLKPTEDVQEFTYYFFCTTDPDALFSGDAGKALKSRMTIWRLGELSPADITTLLNRVIEKENLPVGPETVAAIVKGCKGVPREALVLLEQAITGAPMVETAATDSPEVIDFCRALYGAYKQPDKWPAIAAMLRSLKQQGLAVEAVRHTALAYASATLLSRPDAASLAVIEAMSAPMYDLGEAYPKLVAQSYKFVHGLY